MEETENSNEICLTIDGLRKSYGDKRVLKGISFDVKKGELFGLIGKNGAGKSTTIDCVIGIKQPDEGQITVNGFSLKKDPLSAKASIGYLPSEPTAYMEMKGIDYLNFIASVYGVDEDIFEKNVDYLSRRLDLKQHDLAIPIQNYSHGMQQKLCIMASLIHNPALWILDEPMVGLDAFTSQELIKMMREYAKRGKSCFVASHNIELIARICDRVAILDGGNIIRVFELAKNPSDRYALPPFFFSRCGEGGGQ